jgi:hypothetical protein
LKTIAPYIESHNRPRTIRFHILMRSYSFITYNIPKINMVVRVYPQIIKMRLKEQYIITVPLCKPETTFFPNNIKYGVISTRRSDHHCSTLRSAYNIYILNNKRHRVARSIIVYFTRLMSPRSGSNRAININQETLACLVAEIV